MTDDDNTPPSGVAAGVIVTERSSAKPSTDRDVRRPDARAPAAIEVDEVTGQYSGDDLKAFRSRRPTGERLERLELKHDKHDALHKEFGDRLGRIEISVADMGGQFKIIPSLISTMREATTAMQQREHLTFTARVDVDKAKAIGEVEVQKTKWQVVLKILAVLGAIGTAVATAVAAGNC